jgi:hypothetical protein
VVPPAPLQGQDGSARGSDRRAPEPQAHQGRDQAAVDLPSSGGPQPRPAAPRFPQSPERSARPYRVVSGGAQVSHV